MQPRRTSSFGVSRSTRSPAKTIEPLVTSPRSAFSRFEIAQRRRLAGAVGAEQGDDPALGHGQRDALQDEDDVVVDHLDIIDGQDRGEPLALPSVLFETLHRLALRLPLNSPCCNRAG
jgi:hypothetical protein